MVRPDHGTGRRNTAATVAWKAMMEATSHPRSNAALSGGASLRIDGLVKRYGSSAAAVDGISLDVAAGEFVSLLGASGSGKTTTLMMVAGFTAPDDGEIWLGDQPLVQLAPEKRGIGVVFQNYALFPHMSALKNVAFPLKMRGVAGDDARRRAEAAIERVGLGGLGHRLPQQLSGGQQQRVALARAIVFEPGLLLMDEPLGALDRSLREQMKSEIRRLHRELGISILYVTHDQEEALTLSDRIALMHKGRIVQLGSATDLYERPISPFVASFIGESTLVEGTAAGTCDAGQVLRPRQATALRLPGCGTLADGAAGILVLRPEKIQVLPDKTAREALAATVIDVVYVGDITRLALSLADGLVVTAKLANRRDLFRPRLGDHVHVTWAPEEALILPASPSPATTE
jgi:spermidine/putrescine ABC transporter ATP-binding subunit